MAEAKFPWRDGRSLAEVLAGCRRWLERKRIIKEDGGYPPSILSAAERRLGEPLPSEVREFLLGVQPIPMWDDPEHPKINEAGPGEFFFYGAERPELKWHSLSGWWPKPDWINARGLAVGQSGYGEVLYRVADHRVHPDGCIAVADHEFAMGALPNAVLARSLSEFVAKVVRLKGLSPRALDDFDDDEGDEEDLANMFSTENQELFDAEYAELNATSLEMRQE